MGNSQLLQSRWSAAKQRIQQDGADALIVSIGYDLVYLTGYKAHAMERLTALVRHRG